MGRPAHRPTDMLRRQVETLAGFGVPETDIATVIGIDPKTLRRHYREELSSGHIKANARVAESLFRKATGDGHQSVTAAIFWLKTRAGWKETVVQEVTSHSYIARMPAPVVDVEDWHRIYAPGNRDGEAPAPMRIIHGTPGTSA